MRKFVFLILIIGFTAACGGGGGGGGGGRRQNPVAGGPTPTPTPTPAPFGAAMRVTPGAVSSSASGMAMKASVSGGNTRVVTSDTGVAAVISVGLPSTSR